MFDPDPELDDDDARRLTADRLVDCIQHRHRRPHSYHFNLGNDCGFRGRVPLVRRVCVFLCVMVLTRSFIAWRGAR
jgi:hypothetical protein